MAESPLGGSGYLIDTLLAQAGIERSACFFGVLGATLRDDLTAYDPHFVLLLDRFGGALKAFSGEKRGIDNWRGSVFMSTFTGKPVKVMATFHAARLQMEHGLTGVVRFDIARAVRELATDGLVVPYDAINIDASKDVLISFLKCIIESRMPVAVDIEGFCTGISCIGFALGPNCAFVVPFIRHDNTSYWNEADELELWEAVAAVLEDPAVPKIAHNGLYEFFCLAWAYGIVIRGLEHDTMVMHFELYAEMEKSLGFCTSIYTAHPYYKSERKSTDDRALLLYNGKDCCRTYECWQVMSLKLMPKQREHYEFNMSLLVPLAYMSLRGFRYDKAAAERRLADVQHQIYEKQDEINREAASGTGWPRLTAFYGALPELSNGQVGASEGLIALFADAFCKARRTEEREVEETTWQPCKWNGKKWVKAGKRVDEPTDFKWEAGTIYNTTEEPQNNGFPHAILHTDRRWLKPITKKVLRNVPVTIQSLADVQRFAKDSCAADCREAIRSLAVLQTQLEQPTNGTDRLAASCGELTTLLDIHVKINATSAGGNAQVYLYDHCALPKQFQKEGNRLTTKLASDDEAIIKAWVASKDVRALPVLKMRRLVTESKFLKADYDADGRIRFGFNLVGTPTGRMAAYGSPTGSSDVNPQTWTKKMRDLMVADTDCWIGTLDLSGSDGFSVAAYAKAQGDPTMMDDLKYGLKVAKIIALMMKHGLEVNGWSRERLKEASKAVSEETGPEYPTAKVIQHMSSYQGGPNKMSDQILINSVKKGAGDPIYVEPAKCKAVQRDCFFGRYPGILRWHEWGKRELKYTGSLTACNGFVRKFYGRKDDNATLKEFLASMPQTITTYAILLTVSKQWNDPENRRADGSLRIEPLLLVHDSNTSQWRKEDTEFARRKLKEYFDNPVTIAGTTLTIPAGGGYGPNWMTQEFAL